MIYNLCVKIKRLPFNKKLNKNEKFLRTPIIKLKLLFYSCYFNLNRLSSVLKIFRKSFLFLHYQIPYAPNYLL